MTHVFISYSRENEQYARQLAEDIRKRGFDVWIDKDNHIDDGDNWESTIEQAIQACDAFVVIMSPASEKSERVQREISLVQHSNKPLFPVLLDGSVFSSLIKTQFIDVKDGRLPQDNFYKRFHIEQFIAALKDDNLHVRKMAAQVLGEIGDPRAVEPLIAALKDDDWPVRRFAARALGEIGDKRSVKALSDALKDVNKWVRRSVAWALGEIGDARAVEPLSDAPWSRHRSLSDAPPSWHRHRRLTRAPQEEEPEHIDAEEELLTTEKSEQEQLTVEEVPATDDTTVDETAKPDVTVGGNGVQFSAYHPKTINRENWQPVYAYVFRQNAAQQVLADALKQLGSRFAGYASGVSDSLTNVPKGAVISARPQMAGFRFKPLSVEVEFTDNFERFDFHMGAETEARLNQFATGSITFSIEGVIIATLPISVYVGDAMVMGDIAAAVTDMYQKIFCSYSRKDTPIVERVERAYRALGFDYLRDIQTLRAGEEWNPALLRMIDEADIFQLFWSDHSAPSPYVRQEWEYALKYETERPAFIRPVYWQQPIPTVPLELQHLNFAYEPKLGE